eukprot:scaffold10537_cov122-Isochrysis_galbana.AAC.20
MEMQCSATWLRECKHESRLGKIKGIRSGKPTKNKVARARRKEKEERNKSRQEAANRSGVGRTIPDRGAGRERHMSRAEAPVKRKRSAKSHSCTCANVWGLL